MATKRKMVLKKKTAATDPSDPGEKGGTKKAKKVTGCTPGNPHATMNPKVEKWRRNSPDIYLVEIKGTKQGAVINADDKLQARERFFRLFGIISTDRQVTAVKIDEDAAEEMYTDCNGVIDYDFNPKAHGKPKQDNEFDERDDEEDDE